MSQDDQPIAKCHRVPARLLKALHGLDLSAAHFDRANLTGADLRGARFCRTTMPDRSINNSDCR